MCNTRLGFFSISVLTRGIQQHFCTGSKINTRNLCTAAHVRPDNVYAICVLFAKKITKQNNNTNNQATLISNGISIEIIGLDFRRNAHVNLIPIDRAWRPGRSIDQLCAVCFNWPFIYFTPQKNRSNNMLSISNSMQFNFTLIFIVNNSIPILQSHTHTRTHTHRLSHHHALKVKGKSIR